MNNNTIADPTISLSSSFNDSMTNMDDKTNENDSATDIGTVELEDTTDKDNETKRKLLMMKVFGEGVGHKATENTQRCINVVVRNTILPKMKFVQSGSAFGLFQRPDFTDRTSWVNVLFGKIPSLNKLSDGMKCKVWITYRAKIKEQFSLHRAGITHKIKLNFIKGEKYIYSFKTAILQSHVNFYLAPT